MTVSAFAFMGLSFRKHRSQRLFHYITTAIVLVAAIAYFAMGSNLGWTAIQVEFSRSDPKVRGNMRQIFYVRYIDWFVTTPLLLADLLLTCGLPGPTILFVILMNEIMVVTGLVGALVKSSYKWGFFVFGCAAFLFVAYSVVFEGRKYAKALGADVHRTYVLCGVWTIGLWCLYPIAWGLSEGGNVISSDGEAIFYVRIPSPLFPTPYNFHPKDPNTDEQGILDILAKPGFGALLLWGHRNIDLARLGLHFKDPEDRADNLGGNANNHEKAGNIDSRTGGGAVNDGGVATGHDVNTTTTTTTTAAGAGERV